MNLDNIEINTQSSIRLELKKIIYFDPFKIENVKNDNTNVIAPKSMEDVIKNITFKEYIFLNPNEEISIDGIDIKTIPAYNNEKTFHPKSNNWLGYIVTYNNITYYIAGDTDKTDDTGAYIQAYTLHILKPIYPDEALTQQENVAYMLKENERQCKEIYEKVYGIPLTYLPEEK